MFNFRNVEFFSAGEISPPAEAMANSAPTVASPLQDQNSPEDTFVNFILPADAFMDIDTVTLSYAGKW